MNLLPDDCDITDYQEKSAKLEIKAIAEYRKVPKIFLSQETKIFFREIADFNQWENLKKELQK